MISGFPKVILGDFGIYANPSVSPDGSRIAVAKDASGGNRDIWVVDVARGNSTPFTFDPSIDDFPAWSRDGKTIAFLSFRNRNLPDLYAGPGRQPWTGEAAAEH